ncbi:MAG: hypothetical protein ACI9A2_004427, partial [Halioglobus sp.]
MCENVRKCAKIKSILTNCQVFQKVRIQMVDATLYSLAKLHVDRKNNTVGRYSVRSALLSFCKVFSLSSVCLLLLGISPVMAQDGATECEAENTSDFRRALANSACDVINLTSSDYLITSSAVDYALTINRPVVIQGNGASQTKIQLAWGILVDAPDYPPSPDSIDPEELLCNIGEICTTDFPWMRVEIRDVSIVSALIGPTSVTNDGALL